MVESNGTSNKTFTVVHSGMADFKTITEALHACIDGDTIILKIGQYDEKVVMDKSVNIVGEAESNTDIVITGGVVCAAGGCLKNLSVQGCVDVRSGSVIIENCDISQGPDGVRVHRDANPRILRNTIHDAQSGGDGIYFGEGSRGIAEENEIYNNRMNGVHVNNAEAVVRRNRIHDCAYGVFFRRSGKGVVEFNEIVGIQNFGVYIITQSDPLISGNAISNCGVHAVMISSEGRGTIKDNNLNGNFTIKRLCAPTVGSNTITGRVDNENMSA